MKECDYCGELTKVREERFYVPMLDGIGNHTRMWWFGVYTYNLICEKCTRAHQELMRREQRRIENDERQRKNNWIKKRDKILGVKNVRKKGVSKVS